MGEFVSTAAVIFALWAGWLDWKSRRIPNWLTIPGLVIGVGANTIAFGWNGTKLALAGAALALGLLLPLVVLRGLGAGDWKLMGALGAYLGAKQIGVILVLTFLIAGAMAVVQITWHKRWKLILKNLGELLQGAFVFGFRAHPVIALGNPGLLSLPFGTAAAVATLIRYLGRGPSVGA